MNRIPFKFGVFLPACAAALLTFQAEAATPMIYAGSQVSLALNVDGNVVVWGTNTGGQFGNNSSSASSSTPVSVNIKNVVSLATGLAHVLAIKSDKTAAAWGGNGYGQLGDGTNVASKTPVTVKFLSSEASQFSAGSSSTYARLTDGTVKAWGQNASGQLGDGTTTNSTAVATTVSNLTDVASIAAGPYHVLALKADGTLWSWGSNSSGELGTGSSATSSSTPAQVLSDVVAMAGGTTHSLAIKSDGTVWAWGSTATGLYYGEVGPKASATPVQISNLDQVSAVSAGDYFSVALRKDGTVWAWGANDGGQLGDGTNSSSTIPVQVTGLTSIIAIAGGSTHCLALKSDGTVWAWGFNQQGQLGNGSTSSSNVPVQVVGANSLGFLNLKTSTSSSSSSSTTGTTGNVNTTYTNTSQTGNVNTTYSNPSQTPSFTCKTATMEDYERLFRWAEGKYGELFYSGTKTEKTGDYTYRYYTATNIFLGFKGGIIYFYQPSRWSSIMSLGQTCVFLQKAQDDGY